MDSLAVIVAMAVCLASMGGAIVYLVRNQNKIPTNKNGNSIVRFKDCMNTRKDCNDKFEKLASFDGETRSDIKNIFHQLDNINKKLDEIRKQ